MSLAISTHPPLASPPRSPVRTDIQALRAFAVLGVLVYHLWPHRLTGGYVGVDVFFVVSGFLITDHIVREVQSTGRIRLIRFWARRVRRLLPASLLVLAVTAIAVRVLVPDARWSQFGREIAAAALYVENWALASQSVDYMALSNVASPVQHFWSLSVEEQFYLAWPLIFALAAVVAGISAKWAILRVGSVLVGTVFAASLVISIWTTAVTPDLAYFSTFVRAWEFAAGGLLALSMRQFSRGMPGHLAAAASWLGFALIGVTMLTFDGATPFPSATAALPVLGTLLVVAAGAPSARWAPTPLFSWRPVQFVGDVSYGAYLWHWPLIVLAPFAVGAPQSTASAVAILAGSLILGWLSKRLVEDPLRAARRLAPPLKAFAWSAAGMVIVLVLSLPLALYRITPPISLAPDSQPPCYGAAAVTDPLCEDPTQIRLSASPSSFSIDVPPADILACEWHTPMGDYRRCVFEGGDAPHIALVGDSHATRVMEPLRDAVVTAGGTLSTIVVSGCAMMTAEATGNSWGFDAEYAEKCRDISERAHAEVAADPGIDTVILTNRTRLYVAEDQALRPLTAEKVAASIRALQEAGKRVIVLKDPPETTAVPPQSARSAVDCLQQSGPTLCHLPRTDAVFDDPMVAAANLTGAEVVDLDDVFCDDERCHWQLGGLVVYSDDNHLSRSFARSLTPVLSERLVTLGALPRG